jgi:uncharacterized membrane protein (DUF373 family)
MDEAAARHGTGAPATDRSSPAGFVGCCRDAAATSLQETRTAWPGMTVYERFEQVVALLLTMLVAVLIAVALIHLMLTVLALVLSNFINPIEREVFQAVFGMIMTVLIALEFNHSIRGVLERRHGIVQVRTVVLIALLALVRKFIIIDVANAEPILLIGLATSALALGSVYWMMRDQDRRDAAEDGASSTSAQ